MTQSPVGSYQSSVSGRQSTVGGPAPPDLLTAIVAGARRIVAVREQRESLDALRRRAESVTPRPSLFRDALAQTDRVNVIAECKRRSPSRGVLRAEYDAIAIARAYAGAGAAAISVLTEPTFFDGALEHLASVRAALDRPAPESSGGPGVPLLRKDFVVSEYQLLEARAAGADAVLLIVAALTPGDLRALLGSAAGLGLDVLVEAHDVDEARIAVDAGATIVGVNNRNLRTLEVDVTASERVIEAIPSGAIAVSESGLKTAADLARLRALGYRAFLVGERFMTAPDPGDALRALLQEARSHEERDELEEENEI